MFCTSFLPFFFWTLYMCPSIYCFQYTSGIIELSMSILKGRDCFNFPFSYSGVLIKIILTILPVIKLIKSILILIWILCTILHSVGKTKIEILHMQWIACDAYHSSFTTKSGCIIRASQRGVYYGACWKTIFSYLVLYFLITFFYYAMINCFGTASLYL